MSDRITCREYDFTVPPYTDGYKLIPACRSFLLRSVIDSDGENRSIKIQLSRIEDSGVEYISAESGLNLFVGGFFDILRYKNDSEYNLKIRFLVSPDILESSSFNVNSTAEISGEVSIKNAVDENGKKIPILVDNAEKYIPWDFTILSANNGGRLHYNEREDGGGLERYMVFLNNVTESVNLKITFSKPFFISERIGAYVKQENHWNSLDFTRCLSTEYRGNILPVPSPCYIGSGIYEKINFLYTPQYGEIDENGRVIFIL